jgi:hypothetical protein
LEPAIIIAIVAALPGLIAAFVQYRNRSMNPKENGIDWVVHRYRQMAEEAIADRDRLRVENERLRTVLQALPIQPLEETE